MDVNTRQIIGNWDCGYVLDKHTRSSSFLGYNEQGHPQFDTTRSEVGEALYQLKYKSDKSRMAPLAQQVATSIVPCFDQVGLIIPMPASKARQWQPVNEVAKELGTILGVPVFENILIKSAQQGSGSLELKDGGTKEEKLAALSGRFVINDGISNNGHWNALLLDDLYDTGASMEAACGMLRTYPKIARIYVAALTWK
jgi:predicted amidophosphoribosyltransferase